MMAGVHVARESTVETVEKVGGILVKGVVKVALGTMVQLQMVLLSQPK
jgi:hypothetical protein